MMSKGAQAAVAVIIIIAACAGGALILFNGLNSSSQTVKVTVDGDSGVDTLRGSGYYRIDTNATIEAKLLSGYEFDGWYNDAGDKVSSDNPYTFTVKKATSLSARTISGDSLNVYHMNGISKVLKTSEDMTAGTVTMTAVVDTGFKFTGWYSFSGTLLSNKSTYTVEKKYQDSVVAKTNSTEYVGTEKFSYSLKSEMDVDTVIWIITDWRTGEFVNSFTKVSSIDTTIHPGKYDLRVVGTKANGQYMDSIQHEVVKGKVEKTFTWKYMGTTHSAIWTIDYTYYDNYQNSNVNRAPVTYSQRMEFINYTSDTVSIFADYLTEHSEEMTELQRANYVLSFVQQCITYQYDSDFCGKSEYWKYPYETLYDGRGDCEDTTILFCALMKSMGYDSAMLLYVGEEYVGNGHAAAGVAFKDIPGSYYTKNGKNYYYCETTATGYKVGDRAEGYDSAYVYIVGDKY